MDMPIDQPIDRIPNGKVYRRASEMNGYATGDRGQSGISQPQHAKNKYHA
jgi:hypothetical protein